MTGIIKFFNARHGYGFLQPLIGDPGAALAADLFATMLRSVEMARKRIAEHRDEHGPA